TLDIGPTSALPLLNCESPILSESHEVSRPIYFAKAQLLADACKRALKPYWFISILETCREEAGTAFTMRLLAAVLQASADFTTRFCDAGGLASISNSLVKQSASLPVLLPVVALLLGLPVSELPCSAEGYGTQGLLDLIDVGASGAKLQLPYTEECLTGILLPCIRQNSIISTDPALSGDAARAGAVNKFLMRLLRHCYTSGVPGSEAFRSLCCMP
ncbi:unnamed protein product, partial [Chrysoparadoxa australica]